VYLKDIGVGETVKNKRKEDPYRSMFGFNTIFGVKPYVSREEAIFNELTASGKLKDSPFTKEQMIDGIRRHLKSGEPAQIIKDVEKQNVVQLRNELKLIKMKVNSIKRSSSDRVKPYDMIARLDSVYNQLVKLQREFHHMDVGSLKLFNNLIKQTENIRNKLYEKQTDIPVNKARAIKQQSSLACPNCGSRRTIHVDTERIQSLQSNKESFRNRYRCLNCNYPFSVDVTSSRTPTQQSYEFTTYRRVSPLRIPSKWFG